MIIPNHAADLRVEPQAETFRLDQLVARVRAGEVRVPHFQRGLKWTTDDVVALFDSIVRGFPVGSLLLWERPAPAALVSMGEVQIAASHVDRALWVVDGQQRVTALVNALDPTAGADGKFALVYDLHTRRIRSARAFDRDVIPLPTLFDLSSVLRWAGEHVEHAERIVEINDLTTRIRDFRIPAYVVRSSDEHVLREIFDRMNNAGKRLKRAEIFSALTAPDESGTDNSDLGTLAEHIADDLRWGTVDEDTILRLFLARRSHDVTREIRLELFDEDTAVGAARQRNEFAGESRDEAYAGAQRAIDAAVRFLRQDAGVPHFAFLPYRYLLVLVVRYFAHFPDPHPRNRELLKRWFWQAALVGPNVTPGNITGAIRYLGQEIHPADEDGSVQRLLRHIEGKPYLTNPDPSRFRATAAASRVVLCALWHQRPMSPETGMPFTTDDLADEIGSSTSPNDVAVELVRRGALAPALRGSAGNRLILPGVPMEAFDALLSGLPGSDVSLRERVLASHLLPLRRAELGIDVLVSDREKRLSEAVNDFVVLMTGAGLPSAPPLHSLDLDDEEDSDDAVEGMS